MPLLSLGIPGDSTTAVLIGAFMLQGIQVGPLFITNNPVIWNTILVALLCCNILMYLVMFFPVKLLAKIVLIPQERLYPVVLMMCTVAPTPPSTAACSTCGACCSSALWAF